jgi:hypothetical protein
MGLQLVYHRLIATVLLSFLLGCVTTSVAKQDSRPFANDNEFRSWFAYYYKDPHPERITSALSFMKSHGYLNENSTRYGDIPVIASIFLGQIFATNDNSLSDWAQSWQGLGQSEWYVILVSLRMADKPKASQLLHDNLSRVDHDHRQRLIKLQKTEISTLDPLTSEVVTNRQISLLWSGFNATGDLRYAQRVIDHINLFGADDPRMQEIGETALMSLATHVIQHETVSRLCLEQRRKHEDPQTRILLEAMLTAIVNAAEKRSRDSISH